MDTQLEDQGGVFSVTILRADDPKRVGLFAVGRGGNPLRHLPFLQSVADHGCTIIAPHFAMLHSSIPTKEELDTRVRRLELAADNYAEVDRSMFGIGHSIGAVTLLALAGAEARTISGDAVISQSNLKFDFIFLFAPPSDFFRHPNALNSIDSQIYIRAGEKDSITPPDQALFFKDTLAQKTDVYLRIDENAGHFTYMNELPPHVVDPQTNRDIFLSSIADDVGKIVSFRQSHD
ncbi:hypothetical protein MUU53_18185 [Rhizobium lemnae]|uniref:Alpha/beta hydrolase n=2 Tax=Rhizobium lemnae TaxID=1214924 RepID=A0ABV8E4X3_9HYPH|nr:hypothetical protein [Rhizobium lemnae]MCJ8509831.1 hypothetical protein [Rhizobium lemnae]